MPRRAVSAALLILVSLLLNVAAYAAPSLATNFAGIPNTGFYPADPTIAAGPSNVVVIVNSTVGIYAKSGVNISNATLASWFASSSPSGSPFSPKVAYDANAGHWLMLALSKGNPKGSFYLISVSSNSDPAGVWWQWIWDAGMDGNTASGNFADSPGLGYSDEAVYVTSNQYDSHDNFQYAKLRIIPKAQLYSGNSVLRGWDIWNTNNANGTKVFGWRPAQAQSPLQGDYLINTAPGGSNFITLWKVTNPLSTNPGPTLTLQATLPVQPYAVPSNAAQKGGAATFNTGNCRAQDVQFQNGKLVTAFTEGYNWGSGNVSAVRTLVLDAAASTVDVDRRFGADKSWHYYPAIARDAAGNMAMVFSRSGTNEYAGAYYTAWLAGETNWESSAELKAGQAYYGTGVNYWGNNSGAALDPANAGHAWLYGEYAASASQWGTWIGEIPLPVGCSGAITLTSGIPYSISNTASAGSQGDPATVCGVSVGKGVWFSFTPPADGLVSINTCASDFDTVLAVYSGTCGALTLVTCNDDNGLACSGTPASVQFQAAGGTKYLIFASGWAGASGHLSISAGFCPSPAITISANCPSTPPLPGGVLVFSGQVCNPSAAVLTNVTVFADQILTSGTTVVARYPLLINGECRSFSGSINVPLNVCSLKPILTASGTNICSFAGPLFVTARTTNTCPIQIVPALGIAKTCPSTAPSPGGFVDFTGFVTNLGNISLTNLTVTDCVSSGTPQAGSCIVLVTIPRLDPGQFVQFSGSEGPIDSGANAVVSRVVAAALDFCGHPVNATYSVTCPVCNKPTITTPLSTFTSLTPTGILLTSSVTVAGTPPFNLQWTLGSFSTNTTGNAPGIQTLILLIPLDQIGVYVTSAAFSTISNFVSNACGFDSQPGGFSSPCVVCLSRGYPVSSSANVTAGGAGLDMPTAFCGNTGFGSKWYDLASLDNGMADLSVTQTTATNCLLSLFAGNDITSAVAVTNACTNTVARRQTRLQFQVRTNQHYYLAVTNAGTITNMTYGFVPQIVGSTIKSNRQYQLISGVGPALNYTFQASTGLTSHTLWSNLYSGTFSSTGAVYLDMTATNFSRRFYRIAVGP